MITWLSQRQTSMSISEGEVIAASDACREIVWLKRLLKRITCLKNESVLYIDNKGSVTRLGLNPENHRTKHLQTRHFFVGELDSGTKTVVNHTPAEFHFQTIYYLYN